MSKGREISDYLGVDLMTVWKVAQDRLPALKPMLEGLTVSEKGTYKAT